MKVTNQYSETSVNVKGIDKNTRTEQYSLYQNNRYQISYIMNTITITMAYIRQKLYKTVVNTYQKIFSEKMMRK